MREQGSARRIQEGKEPEPAPEFSERLLDAVEACADRIEQHRRQIAGEDQTPMDYLIQKKDSDTGKSAGRLKGLLRAVVELQILVSAPDR